MNEKKVELQMKCLLKLMLLKVRLCIRIKMSKMCFILNKIRRQQGFKFIQFTKILFIQFQINRFHLFINTSFYSSFSIVLTIIRNK